ncbi:putative high affinity copper protein [Triangularia verruculosa]|uniref:Copper transport protein n=1 Tax=Triangularia verruculosa TaxID=2587418 RepID=A0AAN6XBS1_9PEZI|nr:putative high affinity copper protein [Triangularia verruculosa]
MAHSDHGADMAMANCKISMLWNWYTIDACFLSSSWHITTNGAFAATCIGVILMVILLEALRRIGKEYDEHIQRDFAARVALIANGGRTALPAQCPASSSSAEAGAAPQTVTFRASPLQQLVRALIHTATFGLAYIVMLLAMYYNGYVIISILIGALLGKFLCDWMTKTVVIGADGSTAVKNGAVGGGIEEPTVCCG